MKQQDVRALDISKLLEKCSSLFEEQMKLRFQRATGQLEKTHTASKIRKDIARVKTELSARRKAAPAKKGK